MKRFPLFLLLFLSGFYAQAQTQNVTVSAGVPPPVQVSASYSGAAGQNSLYYYVCSIYTTGYVCQFSAAVAGRTTGTLGGGNSVTVSWTSSPGASSYYVMRFTAPGFSGSCSTCVVAAVTGTSYVDASPNPPPGSFPPGGLGPIQPASGIISLDNLDYTPAGLLWSLGGTNPFALIPSNAVVGDCAVFAANPPYLADLPCSGEGGGPVSFHAAPTPTAIVTDYDATHIQTPSPTSTLDTSGDLAAAGNVAAGGYVAAGVGSGVLGAAQFCDTGCSHPSVIASASTGPALIETTGRETIDANAASLPAPETGTVLQIGNVDGTATRLEVDAFGAAAFFTAQRADGTAASPTTLQTGDEIGGYNAWGWDGTAYVGPRSSFRSYAAQNWTGSAQGAYADVATTASGGTTLAEVIRFENDGGVTVPSTVTGGDKGAGTINAGGVFVNGVAVGSGSVTSVAAGSGLSASPSPITATGTISCQTSTASQPGCAEPDNSTITATLGVYKTANTTVNGATCTPGGSCNHNYSTGSFTAAHLATFTGTGDQIQDGGAAPAAGITQLTGDVTAGPGSGSQAATLATVNSGPGACGDSTHVCAVTTNGKGLTTAQTATAIASTTVNGATCTPGGSCNHNYSTGLFTANHLATFTGTGDQVQDGGSVPSAPTTNQNLRTIGAVLTPTALTACVYVPFSGTISAFHAVAGDGATAATVLVKVQTQATFATFISTGVSGTSDISNGGEQLTSVLGKVDTTLTSWTTTVAAGTTVCFVGSTFSLGTSVNANVTIAAN